MRILSFLALSLACAVPSWGAFGAATQWDVRTTGSDSNGGGFDSGVGSPGTDFSVQNAAQQAYTDIIIGGTTTQGTSAAHPFGSTSPGNIVNITAGAGCSVQRAEVISVSGVTATFDKSLGTGASTCTGNLGGGLLTIAQANTLAIASNTVNIKAGTYTHSVNTAITQSTITWSGYSSTHGDNGTKPLVTTATNSVDLITFSNTNGGVQIINNISFSNTAGTRGVGFYQGSVANTTGVMVFTNDVFDGFTVALNWDNVGSHFEVSSVFIVNTEIKNCQSHGASSDNTTNYQVIGSYIHNNTGDGIHGMKAFVTYHSVYDTNAGAFGGVAQINSGGTFAAYNSVFSNNTNAGVSLNDNALSVFVNNIFYGNTTFGLQNRASNSVIYQASAAAGKNNAYGSNTSGNRTQFNASPGDITTLTVSPFTSSSVFTLNSTAGGGILLKGLGYPGISPAGTGALDIGALQTASAAAGGGASGFIF